MKTKYTYKQIWTIAYPILISLIMEQLIGMTDTAFLGRVGEIELGASAIAGVYYLAIFMMAFGFSVGAQILIARRNGEGNYKEIGPIFYQVNPEKPYVPLNKNDAFQKVQKRRVQKKR